MGMTIFNQAHNKAKQIIAGPLNSISPHFLSEVLYCLLYYTMHNSLRPNLINLSVPTTNYLAHQIFLEVLKYMN